MFARPEDSVFRRVDGRFEPTELALGPWNPEHLHGGAVSGLIAHVCEAVPTPVPMRPVRLNVDLLHPVPHAPLEINTKIVREGKRLQLIDLTIEGRDRTVARASVLRMREAIGETSDVESPDTPRSDVAPDMRRAIPEDQAANLPGFIRALDYIGPPEDAPDGHVSIWLRLRCQLVDAASPSPFVRAAIAADFTSGTGSRLDHMQWRFINPDITAHFERMPIGAWIRLDATARISGAGIGRSASVIGDAQGRIGRGSASLFVEKARR